MQRLARVESCLNHDGIRRHARVTCEELKHSLCDHQYRNTQHMRRRHLADSHFLLAKAQVNYWHEEVHRHQLRERLEARANFETHALDLFLTFFVPTQQ